MPASIGVNLRVTGHCRQGGRKYMEDFFSVAYQQTEDERDLEYAFFGIYDGHGGSEASAFAKEHLMELIIRQRNFWSDNDEDVLKAIKDGYIATHYAMWREQAKWPKTASGLPSTAGTTASIAFIRRGKIYIGHVGDSAIVLGYQENENEEWLYKPLTIEHKPDCPKEMQRIKQCGGKIVAKAGVPRVVWNRPRLGHQGPVRRSTPIDEIPFLAVARSLGDLWSYNSQLDEFVVSPDPDCIVIPIDTNKFRCLIFGTDGLFNMISSQHAVRIVQRAEKHNENLLLSNDPQIIWINPSKCLVENALRLWNATKMRADNTSVITLLLDPPGPPRAQVLQNRKRKTYPDSGLEILTRFDTSPKRMCSIKVEDKSIQVDLEYTPKKHLSDTSPNECFPNEVGTSTGFCNESTFIPKTRESTSYDVHDPNKNVQIHEISSSSSENEEKTVKTRKSSSSKNNETNKHLRPVLRSHNTTIRKAKTAARLKTIMQQTRTSNKTQVKTWLRNIVKPKDVRIPKKESIVLRRAPRKNVFVPRCTRNSKAGR